jgi:hypothetical protein
LVIVVFWLAATGWLFWRDLWPAWRPGEPPPFHIDLVEEVQKQKDDHKPPTPWIVERQGKGDEMPHPVFRAGTWMNYHSVDETFTLNAEYSAITTGRDARPFYVGGLLRVGRMTSAYRVNRAGQLQSMEATIKGSVQPTRKSVARFRSAELEVRVWGEVRDEQFFAHCSGRGELTGQSLTIDLPPARVAHNGSVLMPLHPVNRIHGLRPGQNWRQPLVDPFRDALASLPAVSGGLRSVNARVLQEPQLLEDTGMACLVIEYEDQGETVGRTWVEQDSELVQRQEAFLEGDHWIMQREQPSRGRHRPSGRQLPLLPSAASPETSHD